MTEKQGDKDGPVVRGIYDLERDTLKTAMLAEGPKGSRPASFDDQGAAFVTLTRRKKP